MAMPPANQQHDRERQVVLAGEQARREPDVEEVRTLASPYPASSVQRMVGEDVSQPRR
jgi:hypothetical protein